MDIEAIISEKEIQVIIENFYGSSSQQTTPIGSAEIVDEIFVKCFNLWCTRIDKMLRKIEVLSSREDKRHRYLLAQRGFTFNEYLRLFDSFIEEDDYPIHPVFRCLKIQTNTQRRYYASIYKDGKIDYIRLIKKQGLKITKRLSQKAPIYIFDKTLKAHAYISGMTGSGKSSLVKHLFYHLQRKTQLSNEFGLAVLDPHGDLSNEIKRFHLNKLHSRIIFIDPALEEDFTPVINPLEIKDKSRRNIEIVTNQLINVIEETMPKSSDFTSQMATILAPCLSVLLRKDGATFLDLLRFMEFGKNDDLIALGLQSPYPNERNFFANLFNAKEYKISKRSISTRIQSLINIGSFYNLTCGKSTIDIEEAMNSGKVIVVNLSKSSLDERVVPVFGRFLVAMILGFAFKRGRKKEELREQTFLFIDECQNFISPSVATILDEARKFGLHLILINQFIRQIDDSKLMDAMKTNTGIKFFGKNHAEHFHFFSRTIGISEEELATLKAFEFFIKAGDRPPTRFQNSDMLINNPKYFLNQSEEKELDDYLLKTYYRKITDSPTIEGDNEDLSPPTLYPKFDL